MGKRAARLPQIGRAKGSASKGIDIIERGWVSAIDFSRDDGAGMEPNSPRKIQFTVPLLEPHLDPEAAEQVG